MTRVPPIWFVNTLRSRGEKSSGHCCHLWGQKPENQSGEFFKQKVWRIFDQQPEEAGRAGQQSEKGKNGHKDWTEISSIWVNGAKAVYPGGKMTQRNLAAKNGRDNPWTLDSLQHCIFKKKQKRHTAKNVRGRGGKVVYRRWSRNRKRMREWKPFSGSALCIWDSVSSIAAGPGRHHRSGFWQETTFWGRGAGPLETSPPVGPQRRHYPTPKGLKGQTVQT